MHREPERTCVGCRRTSGKRDLVRVVRSSGGGLTADPRGSAPGRGAYVHRDIECIDIALRKGLLARAFGVVAGQEEAGRLRTEIEGALKTP
jgi:uncharacterized protein